MSKKSKKNCNHEYKEPRYQTYSNGSVHYVTNCKKCKAYKCLPNPNKIPKIEKEIKKTPSFIERRYEIGAAYNFYSRREWLELRYKALKLYGRACQLCGTKNCEIHVDHIKPRSKHPELELDINNLQILCRDCNLGKSNKDETDWR